MSLSSVSGTIGTVVGLGVTIGALGLALNFANRAIDSTSPRRNGKSRKRQPALFDFGNQTPRKSKGKRSNNIYGGDFF